MKEWKVARFDQAIIGPAKPPLEERTVRFRFGADEPPQLIPPVQREGESRTTCHKVSADKKGITYQGLVAPNFLRAGVLRPTP